MNISAAAQATTQPAKIKTILVANRGEIAVRVMRTAKVMGIKTIAIFTDPDRFAPHAEMADAHALLRVKEGQSPTSAHLDIQQIIDIAKRMGADAIHPGYGFLAENHHFAAACEQAGIKLIGPSSAAMEALGGKVMGRQAAREAGLPIAPGSEGFSFVSAALSPDDFKALPQNVRENAEIEQNSRLIAEARRIGFPVVVKSSAGGGGRGIRFVYKEEDFLNEVRDAASESMSAFGNGEIFLEKLIQKPRHLEAQVVADEHGHVRVAGWRDCTMQWRNQKVIEESATFEHLPHEKRIELEDYIGKMIKNVGYAGACTVEFLKDQVTGEIYFGEVNTRIQVEHPVTEMQHGVNLIRAQILVAEGHKLGDIDPKFDQASYETSDGHAIEIRVTARNPANQFNGTRGAITQLMLPSGEGVRVDSGIKVGSFISGKFDPLIAKIIVRGKNREEAIERAITALSEFHVDGIETDASFMRELVGRPEFRSGEIDTKFVEQNLDRLVPVKDDVRRVVDYLALRSVNPEKGNVAAPVGDERGEIRINMAIKPSATAPENSRMMQAFEKDGPEGYIKYMLEQSASGKLWATLTDFRDAWQSMWATRHGLSDLIEIASSYLPLGDQLKSIESFGGATDQSAALFRSQHPFKRHLLLHALTPNIPKQMLFRSSNATGYKSYSNNVIDFYVQQARAAGVMVFRNFCPFNNIENMQAAGDAVLRHGGVLETAICLKGDAPAQYYADMAVELVRTFQDKGGPHIIAIKDMSGESKPREIKATFAAMREAVKREFPHKEFFFSYHTHDTARTAIGNCVNAIEGGAHSIDAASDDLAGGTSQPGFGTLIQLLPKLGINWELAEKISNYYRQIVKPLDRFRDRAAESMGSLLFQLGIPGGQLSNMGAQARQSGVKNVDLVYEQYKQIKHWLNDMIMVTPTSKATGDLAIQMVLHMQKEKLDAFTINDMAVAILNGAFTVTPSFREFIRGDMGLPRKEDRAHLAKLQEYTNADGKKYSASIYGVVLGKEKPYAEPASKRLPDIDIEAERAAMNEFLKYEGDDLDLAMWLVHNADFKKMAEFNRQYGALHDRLPSGIFFDGLRVGQTVVFNKLDHVRGQPVSRFAASNDNYRTGVFGDNVVIKLESIGEPSERGIRAVKMKVNGREITTNVLDQKFQKEMAAKATVAIQPDDLVQDEDGGMLVSWLVEPGSFVKKGQALYREERMKMNQTINAPRDGIFFPIIKVGDQIFANKPFARITPKAASPTSAATAATPG